MLGTTLMDALVNQRNPQPVGNDWPYAAPHSCYPCRGDDRWCVIAVETDQQWLQLCDAMGRADLAGDPRFVTVIERRHHLAALDDIVRAWTSERDAYDVMRCLQDRGVACGVVQNGADLGQRPAPARSRLRRNGRPSYPRARADGWSAGAFPSMVPLSRSACLLLLARTTNTSSASSSVTVTRSSPNGSTSRWSSRGIERHGTYVANGSCLLPRPSPGPTGRGRSDELLFRRGAARRLWPSDVRACARQSRSIHVRARDPGANDEGARNRCVDGRQAVNRGVHAGARPRRLRDRGLAKSVPTFRYRSQGHHVPGCAPR